MYRHSVLVCILTGLLVCAACNGSTDGTASLKLSEEGVPQSLTLEQRLEALMPVFDSFADALAKIATTSPGMAEYRRDAAINQSEDEISCSYSYNFTPPKAKRSISPSDFGEKGFVIRLWCKAMPPLHQPKYAMSPPTLQLDNLRFYVWFLIGTAPNLSPGLEDEAKAIILSHLMKLRETDQMAPNDPNKVHIVLETLDRPDLRDTIPAEKKITLDEYRKIKNKYITSNEHWRPGFAFTYRTQEDNEWRGYQLTLISFDGKNARIAELTQFKSKGWDWIALYGLERCDEVDEDFYIARVIEERSRVVGGVWYGMSAADVIQLKGSHFKIRTHAEEGSANLVYDDVIVSVREWGPANDTGRVTMVQPPSDQIKEAMKDIPYEDERP